MYERLLGVEVERTTWMAEAADDCTYVMKKENEKRVG
jgi:predicted ArsR family transcriptional regulator